jgi:Taurine catabolism dioxygenase TauD, TfdA family
MDDLVLWDQLGLVHGRKPFDVNQRRHLRQITTLVADPSCALGGSRLKRSIAMYGPEGLLSRNVG